MYTQNYEHFKRLVTDSSESEAEYIDGLILNGDIIIILDRINLLN